MQCMQRKINMKLNHLSAVLLTAGLLYSATASSTTFLLGDLIANGGTITVGDKLFSNFGCSKAGTGTPDCGNDINVNTLDTLDYGIQFQSGFHATAGNTVDFLLSYDVEALDPNKWILDVHMAFNGVFTEDGETNVVETVTNLDPNNGILLNDILAQIKVTNPPIALTASADLTDPADGVTPVQAKKVHVDKDVFLSGGTNGTATISFINQRFSQTVPEPSTFLGLLIGGLGFLGFKRGRIVRES